MGSFILFFVWSTTPFRVDSGKVGCDESQMYAALSWQTEYLSTLLTWFENRSQMQVQAKAAKRIYNMIDVLHEGNMRW